MCCCDQLKQLYLLKLNLWSPTDHKSQKSVKHEPYHDVWDLSLIVLWPRLSESRPRQVWTLNVVIEVNKIQTRQNKNEFGTKSQHRFCPCHCSQIWSVLWRGAKMVGQWQELGQPDQSRTWKQTTLTTVIKKEQGSSYTLVTSAYWINEWTWFFFSGLSGAGVRCSKNELALVWRECCVQLNVFWLNSNREPHTVVRVRVTVTAGVIFLDRQWPATPAEHSLLTCD